MVKTWVLIFYAFGISAGGPATAEFYTEEACKAAILKLEQETSRVSFAICVKNF